MRWRLQVAGAKPEVIIRFDRREIPYARLMRRWPRSLSGVRRVLPAHLQVAAPPAMARGGSWFVLALAGRQTVGYAWVVAGLEGRHIAYVEEVAVLPHWQRRGIGRQLVKEAAGWMATRGVTQLEITPLNDPAWIEAVGFHQLDGRLYVASPVELR